MKVPRSWTNSCDITGSDDNEARQRNEGNRFDYHWEAPLSSNRKSNRRAESCCRIMPSFACFSTAVSTRASPPETGCHQEVTLGHLAEVLLLDTQSRASYTYGLGMYGLVIS